MPAPISETIKSKVISQWLLGHKREVIAENNNISEGSISNIIKDWSIALGKPEADAFRELAKAVNAAGLTHAQCAISFRTMRLLNEQNIDADAAAQLIGDIYKKCKEFEVTPGKFAISIKEHIRISDENHIPLNKIDEYIDEKIVKTIAKKKELGSELEDLMKEVSTVKNQKSEIENASDLALQQKKMAELEIKSYTNAKQVLDRYNISINDLPKLANTIKCIEKYADDPKRLIAKLNDIQYLNDKKRALEIDTKELEERTANLLQQESLLEDKIYIHSENLPVYNQLADMGVGSGQLKTLLDKIIDIALSNGINYCLAVNKFFEDVRTQYNPKLGFELQKEKLKSEIQELGKEREKELQRLKLLPFVGPVITGLLQRGLTELDILNLADRCHNEISNRTYSVEVLRKVIINFLQNIMTDCVVNASMYPRSKK